MRAATLHQPLPKAGAPRLSNDILLILHHQRLIEVRMLLYATQDPAAKAEREAAAAAEALAAKIAAQQKKK
eukprot:3308886-Pyramimonas_sp.AAC.1